MGGRRRGRHTKLQLAGPNSLGGILDQLGSKVSLHTANHVMIWGFASFRNDAEGVVLHDGCARDAAEETLLHASVEAQDSDAGGGLR